MSMFDQFKMASEMMKNMNSGQINEFAKRAGESKNMLEDTIRELVEKEIQKRDLISRSEVEKMIRKA